VGKTTLINAILRILRPSGCEFCFCAPNGPAAKAEWAENHRA